MVDTPPGRAFKKIICLPIAKRIDPYQAMRERIGCGGDQEAIWSEGIVSP
tara:strand:+ start:165 stop:314 length:150 start_codon:yes stop_codon:yes gene_type:complete